MPGSSGGGGETVQKTEPWGDLQSHLPFLWGQAKGLYRGGDPLNTAAMSPSQRFRALREVTGGPSRRSRYGDWASEFGLPGESIESGLRFGMVPFTDLELEAQDGLVDYARWVAAHVARRGKRTPRRSGR